MSDEPSPSQRNTMRRLYQAFGDDEEAIRAAYAEAEKAGHVLRGSNDRELMPEQYAKKLWAGDMAKVWFPGPIPREGDPADVGSFGLQRLTSYAEGENHKTLHEAISSALKQQATRRKSRKVPWIRAGIGQGAYVFNVQGFMLLKAAFDEGADK